ncbi:hypothetical protein LOTGIDRAFT_152707 [Lottia gigantea]|uniref:JmjC domain-containing protein n=1 Tax=Lottia gigantea TaxID=225164 RepID=V4AKI2_LOTGI|nr:hypothetical protein LOTGIDRAFT_152707 [Lottia gigantea]ESO97617.1 hypothetical protein LOTGIDRAFT_152707 [Lottia gigantea]
MLTILSVLAYIIHVCEVSSYEMLSPAEVIQIANNKCLLLNPINRGKEIVEMLIELESNVFREQDQLFIGTINVDGFLYPDKSQPNLPNTELFIFQKIIKDRSCLMKVPIPKPTIVPFTGMVNKENIIDFVNQYCFTYKSKNGALSIEGLHREEILKSLFHVSNISNKNIRNIFMHEDSSTCTSDSFENCLQEPQNIYHKSNIPQCERVNAENTKDFFNKYLKMSKPVIIEGAMKKWKSNKWSMKYFQEKYGDNDVHIKMTSTGEYEGVEPVTLWDNHEKFLKKIPREVKAKLPFPDLVVVRPATLNMKFSKFLDLIQSISNSNYKNVSAYLEYSSIREYFPELESDIEEMEFIKGILHLKHLNIWLSDGNTLGKTHFDPFDNFLCQISGKKEVILFEPHDNSRLYEAHIPEAILSFNKTEMTFSRRHLSDSTSLVMSPIDILKPNFQKFPKFAETYPLNCTINEGDVLFMPAFWWHEVQSYPSPTEGRNLAVNFWYEPFLTKEFPCPTCKLDVNPTYRNLL